MRILILSLFTIFIVSCNWADRDVSETSFWGPETDDFYWLKQDTLELYHENEKFGEWGGDIEKIRIFFDYETRKVFGYYTKESFENMREKNYGSPTIYQSKEIEFTSKQIALLKKTISDLLEHRLKSVLPISNAGILNKVELKGSNPFFEKGFFIWDWPSFEWDKFHKLKNEVLK